MIRFRLNGRDVASTVDVATPLLWVLRDEFGLKGTKYGCGRGLCGACTVHLDGRAARSCSLPLSAAAGRAVTTIEGLGSAAQPHPLQQRWAELGVPQCGYCQPGQIMSAAALLARNPAPDAEQVNEAMAGNLCRCGCYPGIRRAILDVAAAATSRGVETSGVEKSGVETSGVETSGVEASGTGTPGVDRS